MATRWVPEGGLETWPAPDPAMPSGPEVEGGLDVELLEERDDGWARVGFSNGWEAWVDGRLLLSAPPTVAVPEPVAGVLADGEPVSGPRGRRALALAGVAVVVAAAVAVVLISQDKDDAGGPQAQSSPTVQASKASAAERFTLTDAELDQVLNAPAPTGAPSRAPADLDEARAARISQAMKAAGFDLGTEVYVASLPGGQDNYLLYIAVGDGSPLAALGSDQARFERFFNALASLPALAENGVTRIGVNYDGTTGGEKLRLTMTATVADLKAALAGDEAARQRIAYEVVER